MPSRHSTITFNPRDVPYQTTIPVMPDQLSTCISKTATVPVISPALFWRPDVLRPTFIPSFYSLLTFYPQIRVPPPSPRSNMSMYGDEPMQPHDPMMDRWEITTGKGPIDLESSSSRIKWILCMSFPHVWIISPESR